MPKKTKKKSVATRTIKGKGAITTGARMVIVRKTRKKLSRGKQPTGFRKAFREEHGFEYPYETPQERMGRQRTQLRAGKKPTILRVGQQRPKSPKPTRPVRRTGESRGAYGRRLATYNRKITDWKSK